MSIKERLESLHPYLIGIRYLEGIVLVDVIFKESWVVVDDIDIKRIKGDESLNYYMLVSENPNVGVDELLDYVEKVIKLNLERESKHELLKVKINELKEVFKRTSLANLTKLKFTFGEEELMPSISDLDEVSQHAVIPSVIPSVITSTIEEDIIEETTSTPIQVVYTDENGQPAELTEEEREILDEELRAERNLKILEAKKQTSTIKRVATKVVLPFKKHHQVTNDMHSEPDCECSENESCNRCIDYK